MIKRILLSLLILLCSAVAQAQWYTAPETRQSKQSGYLAELENRMPAQHIYRDSSDIGGWAHETTHGLNSNLRSGKRNMNSAFYVGTKGTFALMREPPTTLAAIAPLIPKDMRDTTYQLYWVDQRRWWNKQPLYILEEASAYYNGAMVELEQGDHSRLNHRAQNLIKFSYYLRVLWTVVRPLPDEQYSAEEKAMFKSVVYFHLRATYNFLGAVHKTGLSRPAQHNLWNKVITYQPTEASLQNPGYKINAGCCCTQRNFRTPPLLR